MKGSLVLGLLNSLLSFGHDHFDVTRVGHVWVDLKIINCAVSKLVKYNYKQGCIHDRGHGKSFSFAWEPG